MSCRPPERRQHPLVGAYKSASPNDQSVYVGGQFHFIFVASWNRAFMEVGPVVQGAHKDLQSNRHKLFFDN